VIQASKLIAQGRGLAPALVRRAATVELDWDVRQKSRFSAADSTGRELGIFLPRGTVVRGGDVLVTEDGSLVRVIAAPQAVLIITACTQHGTPFDLMRAAYHLGNRHVPIELQPDHLKIEPDHVLAEMLRAMHLTVLEENAAFEPESGAYAAGGHAHAGHDHSHGDKSHTHAPVAGSEPAARTKYTVVPVVAAATPHVHGPGCGHSHGHGHSH
jgi:urease accessory protein